MTLSPVHISTTCTLPKLYDRPSRTACYKISAWPVVTQDFQGRSPSVVKSSRGGPKPSKRPGARLVPIERASCGIAMEVAKADSKTNWEALMNHINESIRDTQQQRMLGQYMIQKLKKEQTMANIPPEQAASNQRCLESLIQRYGTGLEGVVSKEREFERLIDAYQVFMRGDKKKMQRKVERKQQSGRKIKQTADEPLPAIGDQKAGRSQVGCKIRHELRKEYGQRVRMDLANRSAGSKRSLPTQPGSAPKPMSVRVRKSVHSGQEQREDTIGAFDEMDLPPTPTSPKLDESAEGLEETESQLSMTYVPSENQSLAQLIPDEEDPGISVEIKPEEDIPEEAGEDEADPIPSAIQEESEEEIELEAPVEKEEEECLVLEGDSDPNVLIVNSQTELIPSHPSVTPKFEIVEAETLVEFKEAPEPAAEVVEPAPEAKIEEPAPAPEAETPGAETVVSVVAEDTAEPELEELTDSDGEHTEQQPELFQTAAFNLVNNVFQTLDLEAETDDSEKPDSKEVKFKSSPEVVYYDKQSPEDALACHPDDKLILSEDLSTAESELDEDAKALYHKVLSTAHSEEGPKSPKLRSSTPDKASTPDMAPTPEDLVNEQLSELARELTDSVIKNAAATPKEQETEVVEVDNSDSEIAKTAKILTETALSNASSPV